MGFVKPASKKPEYTLLADKPMAVWSGIVLNFIARRVEARGGAWRRVEARGDGPFFCSQPLILLCWIVATIAKFDKMPLKPARKDKETVS